MAALWTKSHMCLSLGNEFSIPSIMARINPELKLEKTSDGLSSIIGMEIAKRTIQETINDRVIFEELYKNTPIKVSTNVLLYGCSGSGKTFLASSIAKAMNINEIKVKGPELLNKYIGASEEAVRRVFEDAQQKKPCLIIFDEFDAIVPCRNSGQASVTDRVVNQYTKLITQKISYVS